MSLRIGVDAISRGVEISERDLRLAISPMFLLLKIFHDHDDYYLQNDC